MNKADIGKVRFLSREDLLGLRADDMDVVLPAIEDGFRQWEAGNVLQPAKTTLKSNAVHERYSGLVNVLPAAVLGGDYSSFSVKILGAMPSNTQLGIPRATGMVTVFDDVSKTPKAVMDAQIISAMRTGAVSAIASRLLCDPDTSTIGVIGAGVNMRTQLLGVLHELRKVQVVKIYSRGDSKYDLATKFSARYPKIKFQAVESAKLAVENAGLVITCVANSDTPVVAKEDIPHGGVTVFNIGCLENEPDLLCSMDLIVADYWEHSKHRGVQTHAVAYAQGLINDDQVVNLPDIISGKLAGRKTKDQRIFFCPTGLGFEDTVVAQMLLSQAESKNVGTVMTLWEGEKWI